MQQFFERQSHRPLDATAIASVRTGIEWSGRSYHNLNEVYISKIDEERTETVVVPVTCRGHAPPFRELHLICSTRLIKAVLTQSVQNQKTLCWHKPDSLQLQFLRNNYKGSCSRFAGALQFLCSLSFSFPVALLSSYFLLQA
jgi:hypothetical protein